MPKLDSRDVEVGWLIKIHRLTAGFSQTELAHSIGVTPRHMQKYEKGESRVSVGRLNKIAHALKMPIGRFFEKRSPVTKSASRAAVRERNSDPFDIEVGRRIRAQRLVRGLSQTDLGKAIGVTFQKIAKYERGADSVAAGRLTQIAQFLKVPVGFFFGRHDYVESVVAPPVSPDLDPLALRLLRAFAALVDEELRRSIVEQVEQTAQSASSSAP